MFDSKWPGWDDDKLKTETVTVVVQVNGKLRGRIEVDVDSEDNIVREMALKDEKIQKYTASKKIAKVVIVKNKLVSIVVK